VAAAATVAAAILPGAKFSALFLTSNITLIEEWALKLHPDIVHLGAAPELLSSDDVVTLKAKLHGMLIMRSVPVMGEESIEIALSYGGIVDFLLLDSHRESDRQIGALGITHDWTISRRIAELVPAPKQARPGRLFSTICDCPNGSKPRSYPQRTAHLAKCTTVRLWPRI
jgi:phosphoribosylanthranilate isomerase